MNTSLSERSADFAFFKLRGFVSGSSRASD